MTTKRRRTWSAFGEIRRVPTEYEVMTHDTNWTLRTGRKVPFEQNPSSPANLWFLTYREGSPLSVPDWNDYRDPDQLTYRDYVSMQDEEETKAEGLLGQYAEAGADATLEDGWVQVLARLFAPARFPLHGAQQVQAYIGHLAPCSYVTVASAFTAADLLRRVSRIAYRTRELQLTWPEQGFAERERALWEDDPAWQGVRKAIETALVAYDWGEAFTALDLVLLPALDDVLLTQFGAVARANDDELAWLLSDLLAADSRRRERWSTALARYAVERRPENADVLAKWAERWTPRADDAVAALAPLLGAAPRGGPTVDEVVASAREARLRVLDAAGVGAVKAAAGG